MSIVIPIYTLLLVGVFVIYRNGQGRKIKAIKYVEVCLYSDSISIFDYHMRR